MRGVAWDQRPLGDWLMAAAFPDFGFRYVVLNPQRYERGQYTDEKDPTPRGADENEAGDDGGERIADGPTALHDAHGAATPGGGPSLGDKSCTGIPFAAHAEPEEESHDGQHGDGGGEAAGKGEE